MSDIKGIPYIPPSLIPILKSKFPDHVPELVDTDREIWLKAGTVKVVRYLEHLVSLQDHAGGEVGMSV